MRFQRLLLEAGSATVTVDLHPRLTIIAGVGHLERESLVTELLGGLAGSRPGTHVEVVEVGQAQSGAGFLGFDDEPQAGEPPMGLASLLLAVMVDDLQRALLPR